LPAAARHGGAARDVVLHVRVIAGTPGGPDKTILASAAPLAGTRYRVVAAYLARRAILDFSPLSTGAGAGRP
jgi:hypothetical protein